MSYIYKITNAVNNKSYIGYTKNPSARWKAHQHHQGSNLVFQAIKKYGIDKFKFEIIAEDTIDNEQKYIIIYNTITPNGYNLTEGGSLPPNHKGKTYKEIYKNLKEAEQQRLKRQLKQIQTGGYGPKKHKEETKNKISAALTGKNNPMYGKKQSNKTRQLISKSNKGRLIGFKNPRAKKWILISPKGEQHEAHGDLRKKCLELGLSFATIHASHMHNRPMRSGWKILQK
jgi:group I intron endonuclease